MNRKRSEISCENCNRPEPPQYRTMYCRYCGGDGDRSGAKRSLLIHIIVLSLLVLTIVLSELYLLQPD